MHRPACRCTVPPFPPVLVHLPRGPITHLIAPAPAGGAESVILALASAAPERTRVICINQLAEPDAPELPFTTQLRAAGVGVDEVRCGRRQYAAEAREVARLLAATGSQLIHTHGYHGSIVGWMAARRSGLPAVATSHGYLDRDVKERLYGWLDRWVMRRMDAAIAVSRGVEERLLRGGHRRERLEVIRNGMPAPARLLSRADARARLGVPGDGPVVGWVGRLSIEKGADLFVQAIAATDPTVRAVLIGDGAERGAIERLAAGDPRTILAGQQSDAASLLAAFDLLAISSRTEGTPMVVLESVNADLPIASFRVGGIPDVLAEDAAWLVPTLDAPALGRAITAALEAPDERRARATRAKARLTAELGIESWLARVWALYEKVWARRR